jgi:ubiquinone/menaquinone biosynthesis C-methylase UbiE
MTNIEKEYYEIDDFWKSDHIADIEMQRVKATYSLIPSDVSSICDVGCGNGIFLNYLIDKQRFSRLHGCDRSNAALKYVKTEKTLCSIDSLPFETSSFEMVTALEVIEHLPMLIYKKALSEICRVSSKYVIITVPNNELLELHFIICPQCKTHFNQDYHMRSYTTNDVDVLFDSLGYKNISTIELGEYYEYYYPKQIYRFIKKKIPQNINPFPFKIPCPVCSYFIPPVDKSVNISPIKVSFLKSNIKKILIKKITKYMWIAGIYKKL